MDGHFEATARAQQHRGLGIRVQASQSERQKQVEIEDRSDQDAGRREVQPAKEYGNAVKFHAARCYQERAISTSFVEGLWKSEQIFDECEWNCGKNHGNLTKGRDGEIGQVEQEE